MDLIRQGRGRFAINIQPKEEAPLAAETEGRS